ncbi:MAG TPA: family 43 glycosylhydrolase [Ohtaekwangia sp.]|uniref:family 43 glycosylhydrolase n=1 Tax=Ohtaekwangia sp. TaxID=2066019 RepID=UPI002F951A56
MKTSIKYLSLALAWVYCLTGCKDKPVVETATGTFTTYCNPVDISYRFCTDLPSRREAADPTMVWFRDRYFLFVSKSGGYWHSKDLTDWTFIETNQIPVEEYAPTAVAINDTLYFLASSNEKSTLYKSADPLSGTWQVAKEKLDMPVWDPTLFLDDDKRLYLYWGCSDKNPIYGIELDYKNNFAFIGERKELLHGDPSQHGWEVPGDDNRKVNQSPWIEGAWINKFNGKYYLQYSGPGTEYKSYSDAVYVADSPLGPYSLQPHNPFAYKPGGFADGAGHGSTFADTHGNYWHIGTSTISQKHMFERRLGLYPTFFDDQGTLYALTKYGDYPMIMPTKKINNFEEIFPGWMLLSYNKPVTVSSSIDSLPANLMTDEDIRTYWAAVTGNAGEYATLDLGNVSDVYAVQINFAEHNTKILGRQKGIFHRYKIEYSENGTDWTMLIDKQNNETDNTHVYFQLPQKVACRYLKITNVQVPGGNFAMSGFRVFGKGNGSRPDKVTQLTAQRNSNDKRSVTLSWDKSKNATGYTISYGLDKNRLYQNYMVYGDTTVTINSLNVNEKYYFTIEAFNEAGITASDVVTDNQ